MMAIASMYMKLRRWYENMISVFSIQSRDDSRSDSDSSNKYDYHIYST